MKEKTFGKFGVVPSASLDTTSDGKTLSLTLLDVQGAGGGVWTGAKGMTVQGTLSENGKVIGTFNAKRTSGGGGFF